MSLINRVLCNRMLSLLSKTQPSCGSNRIKCHDHTLVVTVPLLNNFSLFDTQSVRNAGHSKWQNIRHTKAANDAKKARTFAKFSLNIMKAVINGGSSDPKLNSELASALEKARRANVPKETIERAVKRALNTKLINVKIELTGPNSLLMILNMETDNKSRARHDIKALIKKQKGWQLAKDNTVVHSFMEKGVIRLEKYDREGNPINYEQIEEMAIEAEAEEVVINDETEKTEVLSPRVINTEPAEASDPLEAEENELPCWILRTDSNDLFKVKGHLEKNYTNLVIRDYQNEYIAMHKIELPDEELEEFNKMYSMLEENEEIDNIYVNVA